MAETDARDAEIVEVIAQVLRDNIRLRLKPGQEDEPPEDRVWIVSPGNIEACATSVLAAITPLIRGQDAKISENMGTAPQENLDPLSDREWFSGFDSAKRRIALKIRQRNPAEG